MQPKIQDIQEEQIYCDWKKLHSIPEIGFHEFQTSAYLRDRLESIGFEVRAIAGTGLVATLHGKKPGPSVGLRADMDALEFANEDGTHENIHACGHDAHCSMVLAAGEAMARHGLERGTLILLFQPAEETIVGSAAVLKEGLPHLDALFGIHLRPVAELPFGQATPQLIHQATLPLTVSFTGKGAHAARPHLGTNAISAAAATIVRTDQMKIDTDQSWSAKATIVDCFGNAHNVIPEHCNVTFDIRAQTNALGDTLYQTILKYAQESARQIGCQCSSKLVHGYAAEYDDALVSVCEKSIGEVLGSVAKPIHTLGSEDFHAYHVEGKIPTAYMGLGADLTPGLHSRDMRFNHACMPIGAEILYHCAQNVLQ